MKKDEYIQIGVTAMRDPKTGKYLPAVPMYIKKEDGAAEAEAEMQKNIGKLFADRMRLYMAECKAAGVNV